MRRPNLAATVVLLGLGSAAWAGPLLGSAARCLQTSLDVDTRPQIPDPRPAGLRYPSGATRRNQAPGCLGERGWRRRSIAARQVPTVEVEYAFSAPWE
jgi:hypothetical protein